VLGRVTVFRCASLASSDHAGNLHTDGLAREGCQVASTSLSRRTAGHGSTHLKAKAPQQSKGLAVRSKERATGNVLVALGLGLLVLMAAAFLYSWLEEWLDSQQRYVVMTTTDDWPLRPLVPMVSPTPPRPIPTPTGLAIASAPRPTQQPETFLNITAQLKPTPVATSPATIPVRIVIPKINVNSRIVEIVPRSDGSWGTAAYAVAYHTGTGKLGESDNMVLSGHNNYQGEVFRRLSELKVGDTIKVYSTEREYQYVVKETAIILWTGASAEERRRHIQYLLPTTEPTLTLVSCWPYWVYTHRVYIVAKPVTQ
jgi:sortase A